jgi:hypothetical protein
MMNDSQHTSVPFCYSIRVAASLYRIHRAFTLHNPKHDMHPMHLASFPNAPPDLDNPDSIVKICLKVQLSSLQTQPLLVPSWIPVCLVKGTCTAVRCSCGILHIQ